MRYVLALLLTIGIAGCFSKEDIEAKAQKVIDAVAVGCDYKADYQFVVDVIKANDPTLTTVDSVAIAICGGVLQSRTTQTLVGDECLDGFVMVNDKKVCIKGEDD